MKFPRFAAVGLSLLLAANCFMPCYTLAYADESQEVENVPQEEQKEIAGDSTGGFELSPGVGESISHAADGGAAAEGHSPDDGAAEGAIEDITSGYGEVNSFVSSDISSPSDDSGGISSDTGGIEESSQLGVSSSNGTSSGIEEDSAPSGTKGTLGYLEDIVYLLGEIADYYRQGGGGISPLADINSIYDQLVSFRSYVGSMLGMTEGSSSVSNRYTWSLNGYTWSTGKTGIAYLISWLVTLVSSANSSLSSINSNTSYLSSLYSLLQKQWGAGFGGTIVEYKNSPLYYLRWIYDSQWTAWGYNYDGTAVYFSNSPAGWLHRIDVNADAIFSRTGLIINALSDVKSSLSNIFERLASVVDYERRINENAAYLVDFQKVGNTTLSTIFERLASVVDYERRINENAAYLVDFQKVGNTTLTSIYQAFISFGDRWDSQNGFLVDWAKRWDAMDKGFWSESDKGALFAKLDGISDRLSVEAGQTVLDALLGEVKPQYINDQLTIVKEVARNRFPFCIPAMMQQMLGLMQSEAQVPHWEFDFFGSPLVLDLGDMEGFASVTRWASCFMLFLALLANTKRFIFDLGGGGK